MQIEPLRAIIIIGISQYFTIGADFGSAKPEIFLALRKYIFIEDELIRSTGDWPAIMLTILRAFFEFRPIDIVSILLRDRTVVFFDAALHFLKNRFGKLCLRRHLRFEIGVLCFYMRQNLGIIDRRITLIL